LITVPWSGDGERDHAVRTELSADGSQRHLQPPAYHVDKDTGEKFLRYRAFGWKILDELRSAGFSSATAEYVFAPVHGYMVLSPIVVAVK
jgi:hypothetical protein